jgi:chitinase
VSFRDFEERLNGDNGFVYFWDSVAHAPYAYSAEKKLFATFDDLQSVALKTGYAVKNRLGGIMFWELTGDRFENGLLDAIHRARNDVFTPSSGERDD